jgi:hypothetical protein
LPEGFTELGSVIKPCSLFAKRVRTFAMTEPNTTDSEDRRRPRALMPYAVLWATCAVCVIFAVFELAQQA